MLQYSTCDNSSRRKVQNWYPGLRVGQWVFFPLCLVIVYTFSVLLIGPFLVFWLEREFFSAFLLTFFVYSHCSFGVVTCYSPPLGIFEA